MVFSAQVALYRPFEYVKGNHRTALFMVQMLFLHNCLSDRLEENFKKRPEGACDAYKASNTILNVFLGLVFDTLCFLHSVGLCFSKMIHLFLNHSCCRRDLQKSENESENTFYTVIKITMLFPIPFSCLKKISKKYHYEVFKILIIQGRLQAFL